MRDNSSIRRAQLSEGKATRQAAPRGTGDARGALGGARPRAVTAAPGGAMKCSTTRTLATPAQPRLYLAARRVLDVALDKVR